MADAPNHYAEFGAAFFGAAGAFLLEAVRRWREERRHNIAAGNEAIFVLSQMYSVARQANTQMFDDRVAEVRRVMGRDPHYVEIQPMAIGWSPQVMLPMQKLGFLLNLDDADILNRLALVERGWVTILETSKTRNAVHNKFQELARPHLLRDGAIQGRELENLVGMDISLQLQHLTAFLKSDIPRLRDDALRLAGQMRAILEMEYPIGRIMRFRPLEVPVEGVLPPDGIRRPSLWRRVVRWCVNRWRGTK